MILVTDLSRLSRNIMDFCILLEDLKKSNAKFLSLKEQFDTSTPAGEMMVFNMINLAQFERKQISERVAMNFHSRAMRGLRNGASAILGFDKDPRDPSRYVQNQSEVAQVRRIFDIYLQESSLSRTLRVLESEGIKPKAQKSAANVTKELKWTTSTLQRVLRNVAYIGLRVVNAKNKNKAADAMKAYEQYQIVKASWEQVVGESTFKLVQDLLDHNLSKERTRREDSVRRTYFLTGIIYCEECGRPLVGKSGSGRGGTFRYYVHASTALKASICQLKTISAEKLEQKILNHLDEVLFREGYLDCIERRLEFAYQQKTGDVDSSIPKVKAELDSISGEIRSTLKLMTDMANQGVDNLLAESLKNLNRRKFTVETELESLLCRVCVPLNAKEDRCAIELRAADLKRAKAKATPAMIKRLLHKVIAGITISTEWAKIAYWSAENSGPVDVQPKKMAASDQKSGAADLEAVETQVGHRKLKIVALQQNRGNKGLTLRLVYQD